MTETIHATTTDYGVKKQFPCPIIFPVKAFSYQIIFRVKLYFLTTKKSPKRMINLWGAYLLLAVHGDGLQIKLCHILKHEISGKLILNFDSKFCTSSRDFETKLVNLLRTVFVQKYKILNHLPFFNSLSKKKQDGLCYYFPLWWIS